jgi:hypothetical protein
VRCSTSIVRRQFGQVTDFAIREADVILIGCQNGAGTSLADEIFAYYVLTVTNIKSPAVSSRAILFVISEFWWLRGLDLNQLPSGCESDVRFWAPVASTQMTGIGRKAAIATADERTTA